MATHREIRQKKRDIREAFAKGASIEAICEEFQVHSNYVLGCLDSDQRKRLKNERKVGRNEVWADKVLKHSPEAIRLHLDGSPTELIASTLEIKKSEVQRIINNYHKDAEDLRRRQAGEKRMEEILRLAEMGKTTREIGTIFGISGERVRTLLSEAGTSTKAIRRKNHTETERLTVEICAWVGSHPGCTHDEILQQFKIDSLAFGALKLKSATNRLILHEAREKKASSNSKFTREEMLQALRRAFEIRNPMIGIYSIDSVRPLTGPYYEKLRKSGKINGPSLMRILQVFGSWRIACSLAEVASVAPVRKEYELLWTREELIQILAEFLIQTDEHSVDAFDRWCRLDECRPSSGTIRNQVGPWSISKREALLALRERWVSSESDFSI